MEKKRGTTIDQIITDRVIAQIHEDGVLPWMKPFLSSKMNWFYENEYHGTNKILLKGFEYVTRRNIEMINEKTGSDYAPTPDVPDEVVLYRDRKPKEVTDKDIIKRWQDGEKSRDTYGLYEKKGKVYRDVRVRKYTRVYDIRYIVDSRGNRLEPKLGTTHHETHTDAQLIIDNYMSRSGVDLDVASAAYYMQQRDCVYSPPPEYYRSLESYYRTLFHEFAHSTGVDWRLNRDSFLKYHTDKHKRDSSRSREELVAELTALLVASEAGFKTEDNFWVSNSEAYIAGWVSWMKDNPKELARGIAEAERAKNYILKGLNVYGIGTEEDEE